MRNTTKGKKGAIVCAVLFAAAMLLYLGVFVFAMAIDGADELVAKLILAVYCLGILAAVISVFAALHQRLKEIDGGEEEDAKQY